VRFYRIFSETGTFEAKHEAGVDVIRCYEAECALGEAAAADRQDVEGARQLRDYNIDAVLEDEAALKGLTKDNVTAGCVNFVARRFGRYRSLDQWQKLADTVLDVLGRLGGWDEQGLALKCFAAIEESIGKLQAKDDTKPEANAVKSKFAKKENIAALNTFGAKLETPEQLKAVLKLILATDGKAFDILPSIDAKREDGSPVFTEDMRMLLYGCTDTVISLLYDNVLAGSMKNWAESDRLALVKKVGGIFGDLIKIGAGQNKTDACNLILGLMEIIAGKDAGGYDSASNRYLKKIKDKDARVRRLLIEADVLTGRLWRARWRFSGMKRRLASDSLTIDAAKRISKSVFANMLESEPFKITVRKPLGEGLAYFVGPIMALSVLRGGLALLPLGDIGRYAFWTSFAITQVFIFYSFVRSHRESRETVIPVRRYLAPSVVGIINSIFASFICSSPDLFTVYTITLFAGAIISHSLVNISIFVWNRALKGKETVKKLGYAVIPQAPRVVGKGPVTVIGIVCGTSDDRRRVEALKAPLGVEFISVKDRNEFERGLSRAGSRILIDLTSLDREALGKIRSIADAESIKMFIMTYPYMAALGKDNISRLGYDALKDVFDIIRNALPEAESYRLDGILSDNFAEAFPARPVSPGVDAGSDQWVREYSAAIASQNEGLIKAKQGELAAYLGGKDVAEIRGIIARHQAVATAQYWEDKPASDLYKSMLRAFENTVKGSSDSYILAFEAGYMADSAAKQSVTDLIRAVGDSAPVKAFIFRGVNDMPVPGIDEKYQIAVDYHDSKSVSGQIISGVSGKQNCETGRIGRIAIARYGSGEVLENIGNDLTGKDAETMPSYVLTSKEGVRIGEINFASLLHAATKRTPCFMAIGKFDGPGDIENLKNIEKTVIGIGGFFRMITDVSKALSEIFQMIHATSVAV